MNALGFVHFFGFSLPAVVFLDVQTANIIQKTTDITLKKEEASFGFVVRGGGHEQHRKSRSLVVTHIRSESSAQWYDI